MASYSSVYNVCSCFAEPGRPLLACSLNLPRANDTSTSLDTTSCKSFRGGQSLNEPSGATKRAKHPPESGNFRPKHTCKTTPASEKLRNAQRSLQNKDNQPNKDKLMQRTRTDFNTSGTQETTLTNHLSVLPEALLFECLTVLAIMFVVRIFKGALRTLLFLAVGFSFMRC